MPSEYSPGLLLVGYNPATHLVVRGPPKAKRTKRSLETVTWPRLELGYSNIRLDDVVINRNGQSAWLHPTGVMQAYGWPSETERVCGVD